MKKKTAPVNKITDNQMVALEMYIAKLKLPALSRQFLIWLTRQTKNLTKSVSVEIEGYYTPSQDEIWDAVTTIIHSGHQPLIFRLMGSSFNLSIGGWDSPSEGKGNVIGVCLYDEIRNIKAINLPFVKDIRSIKLRIK